MLSYMANSDRSNVPIHMHSYCDKKLHAYQSSLTDILVYRIGISHLLRRWTGGPIAVSRRAVVSCEV